MLLAVYKDKKYKTINVPLSMKDEIKKNSNFIKRNIKKLNKERILPKKKPKKKKKKKVENE